MVMWSSTSNRWLVRAVAGSEIKPHYHSSILTSSPFAFGHRTIRSLFLATDGRSAAYTDKNRCSLNRCYRSSPPARFRCLSFGCITAYLRYPHQVDQHCPSSCYHDPGSRFRHILNLTMSESQEFHPPWETGSRSFPRESTSRTILSHHCRGTRSFVFPAGQPGSTLSTTTASPSSSRQTTR